MSQPLEPIPSDASPVPPATGSAAPASGSKTLAITSMSLGIAAAVLCVLGPIAFLMGLAAVVTGAMAIVKQRPGRTQAWVGVGGGSLAMLLGVVATLAMVLYPALNQARKVARMTKSMTNAKHIGLGLMAYSTDFKDFLPEPGADLSRRLASYGVPARIFESPNDPTVAPGYIYVPRGRISRANPGDVLLYENPDVPAVKWAVLYVDGHVEVKSKQELEAIIETIKQQEPSGK